MNSVKLLYEVPPPNGLLTPVACVPQTTIKEIKPKTKMLYEVPPPKALSPVARIPEAINVTVVEETKPKPKFLYQVPPPASALPPPDQSVFNKLVYVEPVKPGQSDNTVQTPLRNIPSLMPRLRTPYFERRKRSPKREKDDNSKEQDVEKEVRCKFSSNFSNSLCTYRLIYEFCNLKNNQRTKITDCCNCFNGKCCYKCNCCNCCCDCSIFCPLWLLFLLLPFFLLFLGSSIYLLANLNSKY